MARTGEPQTIREPARDIPVLFSADVVVAGGGTAGVAAAATAGAMGLTVVMIEQSAIPGGLATHVMRWLTDFDNKGGFAHQFRKDIERAGFCRWPRYNPFPVIPYLDDLLARANVRHLYMCSVVAPVMDGNALRGVVIESKEGRKAILAKTVIDATGDGDVAARAGAEFVIGRSGDGACQAMSLAHLIANYQGPELDKSAFREAVRIAARIANPDYRLPYDNWHVAHSPGAHSMIYHAIPHVSGADVLRAAGLSDALVTLRAQARDFFETVRDHAEPFQGIEFGPFSAIPGIRETRRIICDRSVTINDVRNGRRFSDGLFLVTYSIDIHKPTSDAESIRLTQVTPYHIPFAAMLPKGLDNLLVAGRCIDGDHEALASYRVIANCFAMGEAAAIAAKIATDRQCTVRDVKGMEVATEMKNRGYIQ